MSEEQTNKSTKEDKRKQTSSKNAAKARQAKLDKLKKKKEKSFNIKSSLFRNIMSSILFINKYCIYKNV